jgi:cytochrome c-type biogenesis protein
MNPNLGLLPAFLAGVLSVASPCVVALFPVYISVLAGSTRDSTKPYAALPNAVAFSLGFTVVFVSLGVGLAGIGAVLPAPPVMRRVAGGVMVLMGIVTSGALQVGFMSGERRLISMDRFAGRPVGLGGAALLGVAFSAGWSPCVGPVLASILTLASVSRDMLQGGYLLLAYSLGLAIPFLGAGLAIDWFQKAMPSVMRYSGRIRTAAGIVMVFVGFMYLAELI